MLLWFIVMASIIVAEVFRTTRLDYRLVALGAGIPVVASVFTYGLLLHTLLFWIVVLASVMIGTFGRRLLRRRLLGVPVGGFLHLVLDGSWTYDATLWWPLVDTSLGVLVSPELERASFMILLEFLSLGLAYWAARRYGLDTKEGRSFLLKTGQLPRL